MDFYFPFKNQSPRKIMLPTTSPKSIGFWNSLLKMAPREVGICAAKSPNAVPSIMPYSAMTSSLRICSDFIHKIIFQDYAESLTFSVHNWGLWLLIAKRATLYSKMTAKPVPWKALASVPGQGGKAIWLEINDTGIWEKFFGPTCPALILRSYMKFLKFW